MPLLFDMRWKEKEAFPFFQNINEKQVSEHQLVLGQPFCISLVPESKVQCTGSMKKGEYFPCPHNAVGIKKCEYCKKIEEYFPCQFCNGFNCIRFSPEKTENCDAEHMVYLALFSEDIVKVGVSRVSRGKARQFEQGSHITRVFARGISGVQARRIETHLTKIGFPDKIPATQKRHILFPDISDKKAHALLQEKYTLAYEHITAMMPEVKKFLIENETWDMRSFYAGSTEHFEELQNSTKPIHFLDMKAGDSVGGILKMVKGSYLIIETPTELVSILGKNLIGETISIEPCESGISLASGGFQGSLF